MASKCFSVWLKGFVNTKFERIPKTHPTDEGGVLLAAIVIRASSLEADSRVPKHFWHQKQLVSSFPGWKTLQAPLPASLTPLICNCACHPTRGKRDRAVIMQRFQSTNALSRLSRNSRAAIRRIIAGRDVQEKLCSFLKPWMWDSLWKVFFSLKDLVKHKR